MIEYLTQQQLEELKARTKAPRDRLLIQTQYETGCTVSELVNIKREDINKHSIHVAERECRVSKQLIEELSLYVQRHQSPYVFASRQNQNLTTKRVQQIIKALVNKVDKEIQKTTPHLLRYTHIIHAAKQHIPLPAIMRQTGLAEQRISQILSQALDDEDGYERLFA